MKVKLIGEPNAQRFYEAIATIYSRRSENKGVQITANVRRRDSAEKEKERAFG